MQSRMLEQMVSIKGLIALAFIFRNFSVNCLMQETCYEDTNLEAPSPFVHVLTSNNNSYFTTQTVCYEACSNIEKPIALLETATICHCATEIPEQLVPSTDCSVTCDDDSNCGGEIPTIYTALQNTYSTDYINLTPSTLGIRVLEQVVITVNASGPITIFLGIAPPIHTSETQILFQNAAIPGPYVIRAFLQSAPAVTTSFVIQVANEPLIDVVCPTILEVGIPKPCEITVTKLGYDTVYTYLLNSTSWEFTDTFNLPADAIFFAGTRFLGANGNTEDIAEGTLVVIGDTYSIKKRTVTRIITASGVPGTIGIYMVIPHCGEHIYCAITGMCHMGPCPLETTNVMPPKCAEGYLCPLSSYCNSGGTCDAGGPPSTTAVSYRLLRTVVLEAFFSDITLTEELALQPGITIGIACETGCPFNMAARPTSIHESSDSAVYRASSNEAIKLSYRTLFLLTGTYTKTQTETLSQEISCPSPTPIPNSAADLSTQSSAEGLISQSDLLFSYTIVSEPTATYIENEYPILCQVQITIGQYPQELTIPLEKPYQYNVTFNGGSPIYTSAQVDSQNFYQYQDDATLGWTSSFELIFNTGGTFVLTGSAKNMLNSVDYSTVLVVVPPITDNWKMVLGCPCLAVEEGYTMSIDLAAAPNPPWTANVTYKYFDYSYQLAPLLDPETIVFGTKDGGGESVPLNITRHVSFLTPGEHTVTITLQNEFSSTVLNETIMVEEGLGDVAMNLQWQTLDGVSNAPLGENGNTFLANSSILINITSTGNPEKYKCLVNETGEEVAITDQSIEDVFISLSTDGEYTIICSVHNSIQGWVSSPPKKIYIISDLQGFNIEDSQITATSNMTKVIWATFLVYQPVSCVMIDFNDTIRETYGNEDMCKEKYPQLPFINTAHSSPVAIFHTYEEEDFYNVSGVAYDKTNEFAAETQIIAATIPCELPTVTITNAQKFPTNPLPQYKSLTLSLEGQTTINCTEDIPINTFWSASEVDRVTGATLRDVAMTELPSWNYSSLQIQPRFLDYGVYKMSYEVNIFLAIQLLRDSAYTYVEIIQTSLISSMTSEGARKYFRGLGQRIDFNFNTSGDPDEPYDTMSHNLTFFCRKLTSENYPIDVENVTYTGDDFQDMPLSLPTISSGPGCFGQGLAPIRFTELAFVVFATSFIATPETYEFALQISKDTRISASYLQVEVQDAAVPLITIQCTNEDNCIEHSGKKYINPTVRLSLSGGLETKETSGITYKWEAFDTEGNQLNILSSYCVPQNGVDCRGSPVLGVSEQFFKDNPTVDEYIFRLTGTDGNEIPGYTEFMLTVNKPPEKGECNIMESSGKVLLTNFRIICQSWVDPEDIGIQSYTFYYIESEAETPTEKTITATQESSIDLILPYGKLNVFVNIEDKLKAITSVSVGTVSVTLPTQEEIEAFDSDSKLQEYAINGDTNAINQLIVAINSIRDNAEWLDLMNVNSTDNLTSLRRTLSESQQFQLQTAVDTMVIETTQQMKVASTILVSVLESVFSNDIAAINVNLQTKEYAITLTEKIISSMKTATVASPEELIPVIGNLVDSMSAMICSSNLIMDIEDFSPTDMDTAGSLDYSTELDEETIVSDNRQDQYKDNILDTTRERSKLQVYTFLDSIHVIFEQAVKRLIPGEMLVSHSANQATVIIGIINEEEFRTGSFNLNSNVLATSITFPKDFCPSRYVMPETDCKQYVELKFIVWPCIPYFYPKTITYISTGASVVTLEFYKDGKLIHISNETHPFVVTIPKDIERTIVETPIIRPVLDPLINMAYHKFSINVQHSSFVICIRVEEGTIGPNYVLYLNVDKLPLPYEYLAAKRIIDLPIDNDGYYNWFLNTRDVNSDTNSYFIGLAQLTGTVTSTSNLNVGYDDLGQMLSIKYKLKTLSIGCFFFNEELQEWCSDGLTVKSAGNKVAACTSTHMSSFSIGYFPTPNTLDFEYIFAHVGFIDNLTLYITLIIFTCLFLIMFIWAHLADRKDTEKRGVIPLPDNKLADRYLYEVTFWTGPDKEASTSSNIMFIVSGDLSETTIRELPANDQGLYRRFAVNSFVMATKGPLGYINYLRIFHDNSGEPPLDSWQVQRAIVRDIQTSEKFVFETNTWLALDRCDGSVDKIFNRSLNDAGKNYSERFYLKGNRILNEDHLWLSAFLRPIGSRYIRKERVLVCALFLYLSMVANALWYDSSPDTDIQSFFVIGPFSLTIEGIQVGLVMLLFVFPITTLLSYIFKRASPRELRENRAIEGIEHQRFSQLQEQGYDANLAELQCKVELAGPNRVKERNPRNTLPWWTRILAWIITLLLIGASGFFVWSYGIQWGEIKTIKWFSAFLFSFFVSLIVVQFIKAFVFACISGFIKNDHFFTEDMDCDEQLPSLKSDEEWRHARALDPSFRKRVHNVEGVNYEDPRVTELRIRLFKEREMKSVLQTIFLYMLFLVILYIIVNSRTDEKAFRMKTHLENTFLKEGHLKLDFIKLVKNSNDWWNWCRRVILQEVRANKKYNGDPPYGLKGYLDDHSNRIMGYAIIRQVRNKKGECYAPPPMDKVIFDCGGPRDVAMEDTKHYCHGWLSNVTSDESCRWPEFQYRTADELHTFNTRGMLGVYSGGGYVFSLKGSMRMLFRRMTQLHKAGWVDRYTKAVMLEFSVYNPNANLFATCLVMAEFKEGGGIVPFSRFEPIRLIPNPGWSGMVSRIAEFLFCIATILFTLKELWEMKKLGCAYFDSYWNKAEIILILTEYLTIGLYIYKYMLTAAATAEFDRTNGDQIVRMDEAALYDQYSLYSIGFIVFFSTLKLIKLLQFNNNMNLLALTIKGSWGELKIFLMAFGIVFFAFSCLFYFMFTSDLEQFSTVIGSVMTSFVMMMGKFDYEDMNRVNPMSPLLFFLFSVVNSFILINLMLSIMISSFTKIKQEMALRDNRLNVIDFVFTSTRQHMRNKNFSKRHVILNLKEKNENGTARKEEQANELPGKVSQLLDHINQLYFDGRLDMNDPSSKSFIHGSDMEQPDPLNHYYKSEIKYSE